MPRTSRLAPLIGATVFALAFAGRPTSATAADDSGTEDAAVAVVSEERSITDDAAPIEQDDDGFVAEANEVSIAIPTSARDGVGMTLEGTTTRIGLPDSGEVDDVAQTNAGLLVYDNDDGSYTVPIPGQHGDLQLNTVIESASAPLEYAYEIDLPADADVESENGALAFLDADGSMLLLVAPPWARDAAGQDVPTRYEYADGALTQIVEHSPAFSYPIVADPWMGITLFSKWGTGTHRGETRYDGTVTRQAIVALGAPAASPVIGPGGSHALWLSVMGGAGWTEWTRRWPSISNKASLRQQYVCHINAGIVGLPFTGAYNLERSRPNRGSAGWSSHVLQHRCNWASSVGGARN